MRGLAVSSVPAVIEPPEEILPAPGVWEPPSDTSSRVALALSQDAFPGPPCQDLDKALIASVTDPIPRPVPQVQQSPLLSGKGKIFSTYVVVGNGDFPWRHSHWVLHVCQSIRPLRSRLTLLRICATNFCSALLFAGLVWFAVACPATLAGLVGPTSVDSSGPRVGEVMLEQCTSLLLAVFQSGGHVCLCQPAHANSWEFPLVQHFMLEISAACALVHCQDWERSSDVSDAFILFPRGSCWSSFVSFVRFAGADWPGGNVTAASRARTSVFRLRQLAWRST